MMGFKKISTIIRKFRVIILLAWMFAASTEKLISQTGVLFGKNFVFAMTAPSGWVLDNRSGVAQGIYMVFYPKGYTLKNSPVIAYGMSAELTDSLRSIDDQVKNTIQQFKDDGSIDYHGWREKTILLSDNKMADIYYFCCDRWGNYEAAGYILEKTTINFLVFNARDKTIFEANLEKFYEILKSYKNLFQEDAEGYGEKEFSALKLKADEAKSTVQGKEYEELLGKSQTQKIVDLFGECLSYERGTGEIPKINVVFIIDQDGIIHDSYVWPVTPLSLCFKGSFASLRMPGHKLGIFYWHVFLNINVKDVK